MHTVDNIWQPVSSDADVSFAFSSSGLASVKSACADLHDFGKNLNLISFLALAQQKKVNLLPITWQPALQGVGLGGTSEIRQLMVTLQTSFAFKRFRQWTGSSLEDHLAFQALTSEVLVLTHPAIVGHPNIIRLEGICWDVLPEGKEAWPVLTFEKSRHGDLDWFMSSGAGRNLSWVVLFHGDIKPQNVLIFDDESGGYFAKVIDFGYSTLYAKQDDLIRVPNLWPWTAPEYHHRGFKPSEAMKMDVFSVGLLCFWLLFREVLLEDSSISLDSPEGIRCSAHCSSACIMHKNNLANRLEHLKSHTQLVASARQSLPTSEFDDKLTDGLVQFFTISLEVDAKLRPSDLNNLAGFLGPKRPPSPLRIRPPQEELLLAENCFQVGPMMSHLCQVDYRVRRYIVTCMQRQLDSSAESPGIAFPQAFLSSLAFELALCFHMGFGIPRNLKRSQEYLQASCGEPDELDRALQTIRLQSLPLVSQDSMYEKRREEGYVGYSSVGLARLYQEQEDLGTAITEYRREISEICDVLESHHLIPWLLTTILVDIYHHNGSLEEPHNLQLQCFEACAKYLGEDHDLTRSSKFNLAKSLWVRGDWEMAEKMELQLMETRNKILGEDHPSTLVAAAHLAVNYQNQGRYKEAQDLEIHVLTITEKTLGREHPTTLYSMATLASIYMLQGRWKDSEDLREEVVNTGKRVLGLCHAFTLNVMTDLASTYSDQGRFKDAEDLMMQALSSGRTIMRRDNPDVLKIWNNLATLYVEQGRYNEAERLLQECLATKHYDPRHPWMLVARDNLALVIHYQGRWKDAEKTSSEVLEDMKTVLGPSHPSTLSSANNLALTFQKQERWLDALKLQVETMEALPIGKDPKALIYLANMVPSFRHLGRWQESERMCKQVLEARLKVLGPEHKNTLESMYTLSIEYHHQGRITEAVTLTRQLLALQERSLGPRHPETLLSMNALGVGLRRQGNGVEAALILDQAMTLHEEVRGPDHPFTLQCMLDLALALQDQGKEHEAIELREERARRLDR